MATKLVRVTDTVTGNSWVMPDNDGRSTAFYMTQAMETRQPNRYKFDDEGYEEAETFDPIKPKSDKQMMAELLEANMKLISELSAMKSEQGKAKNQSKNK